MKIIEGFDFTIHEYGNSSDEHSYLQKNEICITIKNVFKEDEIYIDDDDGWTVYTEDGKPSAQWEIQVLVTEDGYEIISY